MNLTPDSPELTAYALGALDPDTRARVEAAVASDPALQAEVEAIRACAMQLTDELSREPAPALDERQRERIRAASRDGCGEAFDPEMDGTRKPAWRGSSGAWWRGLWNPAWGLALAGAAAVALTLWLRPPTAGEPAQSEAEIAGNGLRYQPGRSDAATVTNAPALAAVETRERKASTERSAPIRRMESRSVPADSLQVPTAPLPSPAPPAPQAQVQVSRRTVADGARSRASSSGVGGVAPGSGQTPPASVPPLSGTRATASEVQSFQLHQEPVLMKRYGLVSSEMSTAVQPPLVENPLRSPLEAPLSTFALDVDTASYAIVRRHLNAGRLPPPDAVRLEEMVNYFTYTHREPARDHPIRIETELADSPYTWGNRLVRIALKARDIARSERPPANLVFLVDVSGSMEPEDRLPLIQRSLRMLTESLTARDRVSLVTYAGEAGVRLPSSSGAEKEPIVKAIDTLKSGGSTHGSAGIRLAYEQARAHFNAEGINRVILCTDGDFNVGMTSREALLELISGEAKTGVFLTVLGFGMDNYKDATTELLADQGNGNYAYIDSFREARKVLAEQLESTLVTVAKDVKLQVEFNPARVRSWRLLGYENRALVDRDFNDDTKDAGDLGAGHTVTALYELVMVGGTGPGVDPLRYERPTAATGLSGSGVHTNELMHIKLRYKKPDDDRSRLLQLSVADASRTLEQAGDDFRFSAAAAGFAMLLRNSPHKGTLTYDQVLRMAESALGRDPGGYRAEFVDLARRARQLNGGR